MSFDPEQIPSRFDFQSAQPRLYQDWLNHGYFHAEPDPNRQPFTLVIPPPNVTGALHLGHALNNTLQDILVRMKRMQGFNALWMPGTDHAGIATQAVVERRLKEEEGKTRHDLGRDKLVDRIWQWKEQYEKRILGQLQQMGCSCDWDRTRFTLDETCAEAVRHTFFDLFSKELIYRGKRLVNWDSFLQTAVSDDEVVSKTVNGNFWHFKYPVIDPKPGEPQYVMVATTRPETMLGDTAVAVHPDPAAALKKHIAELQEKLSKANPADMAEIKASISAAKAREIQILPNLMLLTQMAHDGRKIRLPLMDREIPIVADSWAKPELGSGCVKITPAHDPNDYEVAKRCNLPMTNIMNTDGTLNAETGPYQDLTMKQARKQVVADLDELGLLHETEEREIELPHSDRSKTPIEPYLADQWFIRMDTLAQSAMDAVTDHRVRITPSRYEKGYLDWLGEKRDWPVSRQLWWGHQIPVWSLSCATQKECDEIQQKVKSFVAFSSDEAAIQIEPCHETNEVKRIQLGLPLATVHVCIKSDHCSLESDLVEAGFVREEDVLDTWFSSALWPHSTLGWPQTTKELEYFYPTSVLITSRDIITLWVARMVLAGLNNMGEIPFQRVFIHPKILDGYGETMSKSKGNGIDPLDVIEKFGADALRFGMADLTTETQDVRMPVQFECPTCGHIFDQTKKNRELPRVDCPKCNLPFSTQWSKTQEDLALPRGFVLSERFERARNFINKLWNASRFAMMNLEGYTPSPINPSDMTVEDRWILSRLTTVSQIVSESLEQFRYADATRELYEFSWNEFCSFYVEMLKERFADESARPHAQRMMAYTLDCLLRLLHPIIPFITEEIWTHLSSLCPERGLEQVNACTDSIMIAPWPELAMDWQDNAIEQQFSQFQLTLGALREIRSRQNLPPKKQIQFSIRCQPEFADLIQPLGTFFSSMASADLCEISEQVSPPKINATVALPNMEIFVDLAGLIDVNAETKRLEKERSRLEGMINGKEKQLANENFVKNAKPEVVVKVKESLGQIRDQLKTVGEALKDLDSLR
ncbi:MAG: valine--tRNA ligase [Mariniblastus sp.]|nr:valine--tRNA ligase [Mariniblastus sp.]